MGALLSLYWRPGERTIAFLMALGGGALLAALTIDLVAEALERGHSYTLCVGCMIGGLLFIGLDQLVSDYGGFLRKASTTIYHMRQKEHRRYKRILSGIGRIDIFKHLSTHDFKALSGSIQSQDFKKDAIILKPGDPAEYLFIVVAGEVEIFRPKKDPKWSQKLGINQAFGRLAFVTGAPHASGAVATADTTVLMVPRNAFNALLLNSPTLRQVLHRWLRSPELYAYLQAGHNMTKAEARQWSDAAVQDLINRGKIPTAVVLERRSEAFCAIANQVERVPFFKDLPLGELKAVSECLLYKQESQGQTLFHHGDLSDRMYIIDQGEVSLIDAQDKFRNPMVYRSHDAFGGLSFITGARHTVSALATQPTRLWVLRKSDLKRLLPKTQVFRERLKQFLQQHDLGSYLQTKLNFDRDKSTRFIQSALKTIDRGQGIPTASALSHHLEAHSGAAIAIWLGIMLDGIPESLVIGASMIHAQVSVSLIVGLFVSNFPEALSSSIGMRQQGFSAARILLMWTSLVLITGMGAAIGNVFFVEAQPSIFALIEGIAAGAMLTMIAQTMLPEAYFKGGGIVGFATLLGFLAAIFSKSFG
jgi:CRP-like cAMP-binding protein